MADGYSIEQIARYLSLSNLTVRDYCVSAIRKMGAASRTHAVVPAICEGIIS